MAALYPYAKVKQAIVKREYFRTSSHPHGAKHSVFVTLACGHEKRYKGSEEPKRYAFCDECQRS